MATRMPVAEVDHGRDIAARIAAPSAATDAALRRLSDLLRMPAQLLVMTKRWSRISLLSITVKGNVSGNRR